jgi:hypothetical protein
MTLLWESPYEHFLYCDCDTIIWGNVWKTHLQPFDTDLIIDPGDVVARPWLPGVGTDDRIRREYFDPILMEKVFPDFPWRKYARRYFCTGVFAARRNCLSLENYQRLFALRTSTPGLFTPSEMPLLNYMIFEAEERGAITVRRAPLQMVCETENSDFLRRTFRLSTQGPDLSQPAPTVLHFTDPKPLTVSSGFKAPVQFFREQCAHEFLGLPRFLTGIYTWLEELEWRVRVGYRRRFGGWHVLLRKWISGVRNRGKD